MDYGRNDWEAQFTDDVIYHRQLLAEGQFEEDAADLFLAARVSDGDLIGARIETKNGAANLTEQQVTGLILTLTEVAPGLFLTIGRELDGLCPDTGVPADQCNACLLKEENEPSIAQQLHNDGECVIGCRYCTLES